MKDSRGLVLEGGGMRGVYTAGVLDVFLEEGIEFPYCIGVSAGACNAVSYVAGQKQRHLRSSVNYLQDKRYMSLENLLRTGNLMSGYFVFQTLAYELEPVDADRFSQSDCELTVVVTDCETGLPVYCKVDDVHDSCPLVQASSTIPMMMETVELDGKFYVDGGIGDSIPLKRAQEDGYEKNVVILTRDLEYRKEPMRIFPMMRRRYREFPKLIEALAARYQMYNRQVEYVLEQEKEGKAYVIRPQGPVNIGMVERNKEKLHALYRQGREQAKREMKAIQAFLEG